MTPIDTNKVDSAISENHLVLIYTNEQVQAGSL
jgi:hypothetical protein